MRASGIPRLEQASLDMRALFFVLAAAIGSGLLFGLIPALQNPRTEALLGRAAAGRGGLIRHSLVVTQIAISLVLLTGAGLLVQSLWNLQSVPLGMHTERLVTASIVLGRQGYPTPRQQLAFFDELESRLRNSPGLGDVVVSDSVPLAGSVGDVMSPGSSRSMLFANIEVEGRSASIEGTGGQVAWRWVTPEYFRILDIPILRGRTFVEDDRTQDIVIVSDSLARRLFPSDDAVGKRMRWGMQGPWNTIVGVAGNVKNNPDLASADDPEYYVPRKYNSDRGASRQASIILRTPLDLKVVSDTVRDEVAEIDATLPVDIQTMDQRVSALADRPRFNAVLLVAFSITGLLLAAIGVYGVISFLVVQRTQEIGVRMALGATPRSIVGLVLSHAMGWTAGGMVIGLIGSLFATRLLRSLLFQVPERDMWTLFSTMAVLLVVAAAAAWVPSARASRTDPIIALRQD